MVSRLPAPIAVIDVETTGLFPFRHDRVIEIAALLIGTTGRIEREFVTLVNPGRDIGPTSIHGLTAEDILRAPQFAQIACHLIDTLEGATAIAGHNVRFDRSFLAAEFQRMGLTFPDCLDLCTMELAGGGRLADCCLEWGISLEAECHHALSDARATASLLMCLLGNSPCAEQLSMSSPIQWPQVVKHDIQPVTRYDARQQRAESATLMQRLLRRMPAQSVLCCANGATRAYEDLLCRVLEDRRIDYAEAEALLETAQRWGVAAEQAALIHREYLSRLAAAALEDGAIGNAERRDLALVMQLLGDDPGNLDQLLDTMRAGGVDQLLPSSLEPNGAETMRGKRICFTGEMQCRHNDEIISREVAEELARQAGLIVCDAVTKKLDILVVADAYTLSGKAKKAREYGTRIMHEPVFWKTIGVAVD